MNPSKLLCVLSLACVLVFSTCSGSSSGVAFVNNGPLLVAVSFVGSGANPVAGDRLRLLMSEPVSLSGGTLDDTDLSISGGGSLGTLGVAPTVLDSIIVEITLGTGVNLVVGMSIDFSADIDAVRDLSGLVAEAATARSLTKADLDVPVISALTVGDVHALLNGTGAAGGTLQAATTGFSIDVSFSDASAISVASSIISSDRVVVVNGLNVSAGENLTANLTASQAAGKASYAVPATVSFPDGAHTISVRIVDITGQLSAASSFSFTAKTLSAVNQPFENGQVWFLDTTRDLENFTLAPASATASAPVNVVDGANGRSDLEDLLHIIGLQSSTPLSNVSGSKDSNEVVMDLLRTRISSNLTAFFSSVNTTFTFSSPGAFPAGSSVPYASHTFSQICIAGAHQTSGDTGVLGLAIFDPQNQHHENDCDTDFQGSRLGVFLHTLIDNGSQSSQSTTFRLMFDPFTPSRGNPAIGTAGDAAHLTAMLANTTPSGSRGLAIEAAINKLSRFTALVVAHECGHSLGLVRSGAMPTGLYGGDATNFPGSQSGHIAMPATVFTGNSLNIMTPAISYVGGADAGSRFNSLNLAYLREQVVHN